MSKLKKISISALILASAAVIRGILGLISQMVIASKFGTSSAVDAFLVALTVPRFFGDFLIGGTIFFAFIPVFIDWKTNKGEDKAWGLAINFMFIVALFAGVITCIYVLFTPRILKIFAPGFTQETLNMATRLARLLSPTVLIFCLAVMFKSLLYAYKEFLVISIADFLYPVSVIVIVLIAAGKLSIYSLAWGTFFGASLQLIMQLLKANKLNKSKKITLDFKNESIKKILILSIPLVGLMMLYQVNQIILRVFASSLAKGSITSLNYAYQLLNAPLGILAFSIGTALFPNIAEKVSQADMERVRIMFFTGVKMVLFLSIPFSIVLALLSQPIVKLIFERGSFTAASTSVTSKCLLFYALGLFAASLYTLCGRIFYSLKDMVTPFKVGIIGVATNVFCALILKEIIGAPGLALSFSIYVTVSAALSLFLLDKKMHVVKIKMLIPPFVKILAISILTGIVVWCINSAINLFAALFFGVITYILLAYSAKMEELHRVKEMFVSLLSFKQISHGA